MSGFNGSGTYVRGFNWVNDAAASIPITASRVDSDMQDVVNGFNNTVTRDGQGKMTAAFQAIAGSQGAPSITFQGATGAGFYAAGGTAVGVAGGMTFGATGAAIQGDFTNATVANRVALQSSVTNGATAVSVLPNGTATYAAVSMFSASPPTNSNICVVGVSGSNAFLQATISGTGVQGPLQLQVGNNTYFQIGAAGNLTTPTVPASGTTFAVGAASGQVPLTLNVDGGGTFFEAGTRDLMTNVQSGNYTLALTDRGKMVKCTNAGAQTITIPANGSIAFPSGAASGNNASCITIVNRGTTAVGIAITTDTLRYGGLTGSRTLAVDGIATLIKTNSTEWVITGSGLT